MFPNPFFNTQRRLRNGWWIAIFMAMLAAMLAPLIAMHSNEAAGVPIWQQAILVMVASVLAQAARRRALRELTGRFDAGWLRQFTLGAGVGAALMAAPALALAALGLVHWPVSQVSFVDSGATLLLFMWVALAEEVLFRGFVFQRLLAGLGQWPAQFVVGGFFVLTHSSALEGAGALAPMAGLNLFLASILFGLAFIRTQSLAMPIGIHFAANWVQGGVLGFGVSGNAEQGILTPVLAPGLDWLTGGAFGLEASAPGLAFVIIVVAALWRWRPVTPAVGVQVPRQDRFGARPPGVT